MLSFLRSTCKAARAATQAPARLGFIGPASGRFAVCPQQQPPVREFRPCEPLQMGRRAAKIAGRKGKADALRAKLYGRIGKKVVQLVKAGGPDPVANSKLGDLLKQAKDLGVPKDLLDRNIKRASDKSQSDYQEVCYEAYGPGGTGFIVECLTDNLNRTAGDVKMIITKLGCKVAEPGSVMFNFAKQGKLVVKGSSEDAVFEAAMEIGADDISPVLDEDGVPTSNINVFVAMEEFGTATAALTSAGLALDKEESSLVYRAAAAVEVDDEAFEKCEALMERLLELDDVDAVYTNADGLAA